MEETVFYTNITKLCELNGVSITALAKKVGKNSSTATGWKNGALPRPETMKAIADFFGVSINALTSRQSQVEAHIQTNNGYIGNSQGHVVIENKIDSELTATEKELIRLFRSFSIREQTTLLGAAYELEEQKNK